MINNINKILEDNEKSDFEVKLIIEGCYDVKAIDYKQARELVAFNFLDIQNKEKHNVTFIIKNAKNNEIFKHMTNGRMTKEWKKLRC